MSPDARRLRGLAAALALVVAAGGCKPLDDVMVWAAGRSMRDSRSLDPYENPRPAPENSVPFASGNNPAEPGQVGLGQAEAGPWVPSFTAQDMLTGGAVANTLVNPVEADEASLARGELMYGRYCAVCHAATGMSTEAPIFSKLPQVAAANLALAPTTTRSDGYIYGMIRVGRGAMPAYGHAVTHYDRWHIVNYVRELQRRAGGGAAAVDTAGAAAGGDPG